MTDVHFGNIETLIKGADVVLDGTDNFETRYLINDACVKNGIPWIYGGVIAGYGMTMTIRPGIRRPACAASLRRCRRPERRPPATRPASSGPSSASIASIESTEAIKLITGQGRLNEGLITVDLWENCFETIATADTHGGLPRLRQRETTSFSPPGRGSTQRSSAGTTPSRSRSSPQPGSISPNWPAGLPPSGEVTFNEFMLRLTADGHEMTVFPDARAIVKGTTDESRRPRPSTPNTWGCRDDLPGQRRHHLAETGGRSTRRWTASSVSRRPTPAGPSHRMALAAGQAIQRTRLDLARLFNVANPDRIVFACNATDALNTALKGLLRPGDHVVTSSMEHNSVLRPLKALEKRGVTATRVGASGTGWLDPARRQAGRDAEDPDDRHHPHLQCDRND